MTLKVHSAIFTRIYKDKGTPRRPEEPITSAGPECGLQKAAQHQYIYNIGVTYGSQDLDVLN